MLYKENKNKTTTKNIAQELLDKSFADLFCPLV